jgi:hypothetical protein
MQSGAKYSNNPDSEILNGVSEIAQFMRLSSRTVGALIKTAGLPTCRVGLGKSTTKTAVVNWLTRRAEGRIDG